MTANPLIPNTPGTPGTPGNPGFPSGSSPGNFPGSSPAMASRLTPLDPLRVLRQNLWVLVASLGVGVVLGLCVYFPVRKYSPEYSTEALFSIAPTVTDPYQRMQSSATVNQQAEVLLTTINNHIIRIKSDDTLADALRRDDVRQTQWFKSFSGDARAALSDLSRNLSVGPIRGSSVIRVSLRGKYSDDLPKVLAAVTTVYLQREALAWENQTSGLRRTFVQEVDRAEQELQQIQESLRRFTMENDLPTLDSRSRDADVEYQTLASREAELRAKAKAAEQGYEALLASSKQGRLSPTPQESAEVEADMSVLNRSERLRQLREQRDVLLNRFGENHRSVQDVDQQVSAVEVERQRLIDKLYEQRQQVRLQMARASADTLTAEMQSLAPQIAKANQRLRELNVKALQYKQIASSAEDARQRRDKAQDLLNSMRLQSQRPDNVSVQLQLAATEAQLSFPRMSGVVPGVAILTLLLTMGLVFLRELLDQRIKSPADLRSLSNADLLSVLHDASEDPSGATRVENVVVADPGGLMAETFRQLRTTVLGKMERRQFRTLLVTGASAQSGVSSLVNNLALSVALHGRKVLVIDANWRRPTQYKLFDTPARPGLIEVLRGGAELSKAIVHKDEPSIDVLPAGNMLDADAELLEGAAFRKLLSELGQMYELVIIDGPPVLLAGDSQAIAGQVDAIVMVVRAMSEQRGMVARVARQLQGQRAELLGLVLNGVRSSAGGYFRKNYQEYYRYNQASIDVAARRKATASAIKRSA